MFIPLSDLKQIYTEGRFYFLHDDGADYVEADVRTFDMDYCIKKTLTLAENVRVIVSIVPVTTHCQLTLEGQTEPFYSDYLPHDVPKETSLHAFAANELQRVIK